MTDRPFLRRLAAAFLIWMTLLLVVSAILARPRDEEWVGYAILGSGGFAIGFTEHVAWALSLVLFMAVVIAPPVLLAWIWNRHAAGSHE